MAVSVLSTSGDADRASRSHDQPTHLPTGAFKMSVRKRKWKTAKGVECEAWVVDYVDQGGERRLKTFQTRKEADAWSVTARHEVQQGTHTPESKSITVAEAAEDWITFVKLEQRERSTVEH